MRSQGPILPKWYAIALSFCKIGLRTPKCVLQSTISGCEPRVDKLLRNEDAVVMPPECPPTRHPFSAHRRILLVTACAIVLLATIGLVFLIRYWPFNERQIVETLQETIPGTKVTIARFHNTHFVHPGCWAEGLVFVRLSSPAGLPPLIVVERLVIQANYHDLFLRPGYISRIIIDGLHIQVPPPGSSVAPPNASQSADASPRRTVVGEIASSGILLEIGRRDDSPLKFNIHDVTLHSVGVGKVMSYNVNLQIPLPPGEIQSTGKLGPWNSNDLGQNPVSGTYKFERANLGVFSGIAGTLSSIGQFDGILAHIEVAGDTDIPNFAVKAKGHAIHLSSRFQVKVNGTNGDIGLTRVNVLLQNTPIEVRGSVLGKSPEPGKTTSLDLIARGGRVQDILRLFVKAPVPPMSGAINFRAHVVLPSDRHPFLKKVGLTGDFTVDNGRFAKAETQESVNKLSESSRGVKNRNGDAELVESSLSSHVNLSAGVATFSNLSFSIPGALAQMNGKFNVLNEKLNFRGTLKTDAELSQTTHGIKAVLLKPLDPLFKRKHHGASIPIEMTGAYSQPHFGMEIVPKH